MTTLSLQFSGIATAALLALVSCSPAPQVEKAETPPAAAKETPALPKGAVPLEILEPAERSGTVKQFPVAVGLVFPQGELKNPAAGAVLNDLGEKVPFESKVTAWWSAEKDSIKWLLLNFRADTDRKYFFDPAGTREISDGPALARSRDDGAIEVDTGKIKVRLEPGEATVFRSVEMDGEALVGESSFVVEDDEGRALQSGGQWRLQLVESSPLRAVIRAEGPMALAGQESNPLLRLVIRYEFFKGESFVRMDHTFVWMQKSLEPGANAIALRLKPKVGSPGTVRIGLSDFTGESFDAPFSTAEDLVAFQENYDRYLITEGSKTLAQGEHLGGWISVEGQGGRGVGMALRNAWQTYPTAFAVRGGALELGLWPVEAGRFSFEERDIMPDDFYYSDYWKNRPNEREGGPSWFNTRDLEPEQFPQLLQALQKQIAAKDQPSPGRRIGEFLSQELRDRIEKADALAPATDGFRARLAHGMNAFLADRDFYRPEDWTGVELRPKARELLSIPSDKRTRRDVVWLNRLLIESAYPGAFSPSDKPHFIHEFSEFGAVPRPQEYLHTGEGVARTHQITVLFFNGSTQRSMAELNSLAQHPLVIRQDPESATRVPLFGYRFSAVDREKYPDLERAVDFWGQEVIRRFPELNEYGFLRFGLARNTTPRADLYRWVGGMQYDYQITPWLLFWRGGGREYYEAALDTTQYAMDVHTNHFNTRNHPTGYMSFVSGMPLPWAAMHRAFNMRAHFLMMSYYLTGYDRAREVLQTAIDGRKAAFQKDGLFGKARELFGDNMFLAHAYQATFDPELLDILKLAKDETLARNYNAEANLFRSSHAYLFNGLIPMQEILADERLQQVMLDYLGREGFPALVNGGIPDVISTSSLGWAYENTGDERFARVLFDQATIHADVTPEDGSGGGVPPNAVMGISQIYEHRLLPLLVAMGTKKHHGLQFVDRRPEFHSLFFSLADAGAARTAYVKPARDGSIRVRLIFQPVAPAQQVENGISRVFYEDKRLPGVGVAASVAAPEGEQPVVRIDVPPDNAPVDLTLQGAHAGRVVRLEFNPPKTPATQVGIFSDDAQIVHGINPASVHAGGAGLRWQYDDGTRIFLQSAEDEITLTSSGLPVYSLRDALTGELLARGSRNDPSTSSHKVGKGRLLELVVAGGRDARWSFRGVKPFVAARKGDWFDPSHE